MINPTVGRIVWYRPDEADKKGSAEPPMQTCGDDPLAAQIVAVHGPRMVSVALYDAAGRHFARPSVALLQDDDKIPSGRYVEWMPYQRERTAAIRVPTLVICGTEDKVTPPTLSHELVQLIPGASYAPIEGAGHLGNIERPEAFNTLVDAFIRNVDSAAASSSPRH